MYSRLISSLLFGALLAVGSPFSPGGKIQRDDNPIVIQTKAPAYPAIALAAHAAGTVLVDVETCPDGTVATAKAISGPPLLFAVSTYAALGWRFSSSPNGVGNRRVRLTFDFVPDTSACDHVYAVTPY